MAFLFHLIYICFTYNILLTLFKHLFMKKVFTLISFLVLLAGFHLQAQFGPDVRIQKQPGIEQGEVKVSVAFNGWVFAAFTTYDSATTAGGITIRRSKDNGQTWESIDAYAPVGTDYPTMDMVVAGTDTNSLVLYLVGVNRTIASGTYTMFVDRYDGNNGVFLGNNFTRSQGTRKIYDVAIASDYMSPAVGTSPYSVAFVYSVYSPSFDSIVYVASIDGGSTFTVDQFVDRTGYYFRKVDIAYGQSSSGSNGRYFVAYERFSSSNAWAGNIYTSRNASMVNGSFAAPVCLDSVSTSMIGLCANPKIAAMVTNSFDNDSGSVSAVVLVERDYNGNGSDFDLLGFYNKRAHYSDFWNRLDIQNTGNTSRFPDIAYSIIDSQFVATYLDSTAQEMPMLYNNYQLITPSSWNTISSNYNDGGQLGSAYPSVAINPQNGKGAVAWHKVENGRGTAYFDAVYSTITNYSTSLSDTICNGDSITFGSQTIHSSGQYTDTLEAENALDSVLVLTVIVENCLGVNEPVMLQSYKVFPNPFSSTLMVEINTPDAARIPVTVTDVTGRVIYSGQFEKSAGTITYTIPGSADWLSGVYVLSLNTQAGIKSLLVTKE